MRPYQFLPMPFPAEYDPGPVFFYDNIAKAFIPDMIKMMNAGLHIDQDAVEDLRKVVDQALEEVAAALAASPLIQRYQADRLPEAQKKHAEEATQACRTVDYYLKQYKPGDMLHRTWVMNTYLKHLRRHRDCREKWTIKDMKSYNIFLRDPFVQNLIDKRPLSQNTHVVAGMRALAEYKVDLWNRPRYAKAEEPVDLDPFNANSSKQVKEFFEMLEITPLAYSKDTGEASWGREQIELLKKETDDEELQAVLDAMILNSYSAIIRNNFLKAFDTFTVDGVLHGNIKLFGAKSFRNTSNSPNLLNAPSSRSMYAKPLKKCFRAADGKIIYAIDLSALEDRVIANVSKDTNKCNVFLEDLDGHSLNACGYFPEEIAKVLGPNTDNVAYVKEFFRQIEEEENAVLDKIRSKSKAPTFKLAYGGYPDADRGGVITQELFDNYHNVLYPGITKYREEYVLDFAQRYGYVHLGLGCRLYSNDPGTDIRTLHNATIQFWSILTLIAINELNFRIEEEGLEDHVEVQSTIYDSIYTHNTRDAEILKWVNDNLVEVLTVQYLEDQVVPNAAKGEIGPNWADLHKLSNGASIDEIKEVLKGI
jgi:hypothetical protein